MDKPDKSPDRQRFITEVARIKLAEILTDVAGMNLQTEGKVITADDLVPVETPSLITPPNGHRLPDAYTARAFKLKKDTERNILLIVLGENPDGSFCTKTQPVTWVVENTN